MSIPGPIAPDDLELDGIVRKKITCPFLGPAVRRRDLAVFNTPDRPMAAIGEIAELGDTGGGDLGRRVLKLFATGNHRRVPDAAGRFDAAAPDGMMSLDLAGSQGAHPGHSGILLGNPALVDSGRFSAANFARLTGRADAEGRITMEAIGEFIAENLAHDPEARVLPLGRLAGGLFGVADEVFDNLQARLFGRKTERDDAELIERLTKLAGADNLIGSAGEFGLLFAFFARRPEDLGGPGVRVADLQAMMVELELPEGWRTWPKRATDWIHATTRITAFAIRARLRG